MKQLCLNDEALPYFFEEPIDFDLLVKWVQHIILFDTSNSFRLNEAFSCYAYTLNDSSIMISGDEDSSIITLIDIVSINLI